MHQALIDHWPRLRRWLDEDAAFLAWLADLRQDTQQWEQANRESGRLLSGAALSEAEKWVDTRRSDIPESQRNFIAQSRSHQRRRIRRLRVTIAVVTVLALIAGTSSVVALRSNATINEQLHEARATLIAQEAGRVDRAETGLQLALAAWRESPGNADAYGALLSQWLQWRPVRALYPKHRGVDVYKAYESADGRTVIAVNDSERAPVQIWTHFERPTPAVAELPVFDAHAAAISPDGKLIATVSSLRAVDLWSTATRQRVRRLQAESVAFAPESLLVPRLRFSGDGRYLSLVPAPDWEDTLVKTWDTTTSALIDGASDDDSEPPVPVTDVSPTRDPERFLAKVSGPEESPGNEHVLELVNGSPGHDFGVGQILSNGDEVLLCGPNGSIDIVDAATKTVAQHFDNIDCSLPIYSSGEYLYWTKSDSGQPSVHALHRPSGARYNADFSTAPLLSPDFATFLPGNGDSLDAVMLGGNSFYRASLSRELRSTGDWGNLVFTRTTAKPRDNKVAAATDRGELVILDETYTRLLARTRAPTGNFTMEFSSDERQLYAATRDKLFVYRVDNLALQRVITIPEHPGVDPAAAAESITHLLPLAADDLVVLHAGLLTRWNPRTAERIGNSIVLAQDPYKLHRIVRTAHISARPAHPGQVIVHSDEFISVWDVARRENIREIRLSNAADETLMTVEPSGVMAAYTTGFLGDETGLVNLDTGQTSPPLRGNNGGNPMLMVTPLLLSTSSSEGSFSLDVWHWPKRSLIAEVTVPGTRDWFVTHDRIVSYRPGRKPFAIPLDPYILAHQLCRISDREFTPDEIPLLPAGTSHERPCADIR